MIKVKNLLLANTNGFRRLSSIVLASSINRVRTIFNNCFPKNISVVYENNFNKLTFGTIKSLSFVAFVLWSMTFGWATRYSSEEENLNICAVCTLAGARAACNLPVRSSLKYVGSCFDPMISLQTRSIPFHHPSFRNWCVSIKSFQVILKVFSGSYLSERSDTRPDN